MLDFYLDEAGKPENVAMLVARGPVRELERIALGGIDIEPFHALQQVWDELAACGIVLDYFSDFSLTSAQVAAVHVTLKSRARALSGTGVTQGIDAMSRILGAAIARGAGVVAICD